MNPSTLAVRALTVLWPAFGTAAVIEGLVFSLVDPHDLRWLGTGIDLDRSAVYSISFLLFWALTSAAAAMTLVLATPRDRSEGES